MSASTTGASGQRSYKMPRLWRDSRLIAWSNNPRNLLDLKGFSARLAQQLSTLTQLLQSVDL